MREMMNPWTFVVAAYVVGVGATLGMVAWSLLSMRRAEKRRDSARGSGGVR
ncbi:hypothetical protein [Novosphingobium resinovorum]|uniref:hypothetical protein n=1 Tax=Novosphingobium resinovorum TaxID=158500 RepID=UPI002ECFF1D4|nr:hypothetical protein [Novosphingobium resinovorum]